MCYLSSTKFPFNLHEVLEYRMSDTTTYRVGDTISDFTLTTFEASTGGFGEYNLEAAKSDDKWTVLFFYPADFTFV